MNQDILNSYVLNSHNIFVKNKLKKAAEFIRKNSKILDIGCGEGKILEFLDNSIDYYGVDIDKKEINKLNQSSKNKKIKKIKAKTADLNKQELPFKNQKFDYVLLLDIIEHVIDPRKLLREVKKRLKKDGKIIATLPNDYHILNKLRFLFNKHLTADPFAPYGHLHYFPIKTGEKLIEQDFKILKKILVPPTKPFFVPQPIKNFLTKLFPQSFARDILYIAEKFS